MKKKKQYIAVARDWESERGETAIHFAHVQLGSHLGHLLPLASLAVWLKQAGLAQASFEMVTPPVGDCPWCWRWDFLIRHKILRDYRSDRRVCRECCQWINDIVEVTDDARPPWQPDARARRQAHLRLATKFPLEIAMIIAEFERSRWDP